MVAENVKLNTQVEMMKAQWALSFVLSTGKTARSTVALKLAMYRDEIPDKCHHIAKISENQWPSTTKSVNQNNAKELRNESDDRIDRLHLKSPGCPDSDLSKDIDREVLDRRNSCHLRSEKNGRL
jgi:hypothetical protein